MAIPTTHGEQGTVLKPVIMPIGDCGVLVRFASVLSDHANRAAIGFARSIGARPVTGVTEIVPNLVSVLVRYDPRRVDFPTLTGEIRLVLGGVEKVQASKGTEHAISVRFGGADGPDLDDVAQSLDMPTDAFLAAHSAHPLRVLATGFAPGFVYCGLHGANLVLPRRQEVRREVPAGSILFAAGQTAIAGTAIPTGWHVIGRTDFRNFDPEAMPPTRLAAGDTVRFAIAEQEAP